MKTLLAYGAALGLLGVSALGIPQTFNNNQFLLGTGVSFEQFTTDDAAWGDASNLKGHWEAHGDTLTLTDSAAVFGVLADEVTAIKVDGGVEMYRVVFRGKDKQGHVKPGNLLAQVTANVRALTGDSGTSAQGGGTVFKYKSVAITLRSGAAREVEAVFTVPGRR